MSISGLWVIDLYFVCRCPSSSSLAVASSGTCLSRKSHCLSHQYTYLLSGEGVSQINYLCTFSSRPLPSSCRLQYEAYISYIQSQTSPSFMLLAVWRLTSVPDPPSFMSLAVWDLHQLYSVPDPPSFMLLAVWGLTSVIFSPRPLPASCRLQYEVYISYIQSQIPPSFMSLAVCGGLTSVICTSQL